MAVTLQLQVAVGQPALTDPADLEFVTVDAAQSAGFSTHRGRTYFTDRTDAGTATANFNDKTGVFDPTNTGSPLAPHNPNTPAALNLLNPYTNEFKRVFTGLTQQLPQNVRQAMAAFNQGGLSIVDLLSLLAVMEVPPGLDFDSTATGDSLENVSGDTTYSLQTVQDRILAICADAQLPADMLAINSGNVYCQPTVYSPGSFILAALQDATDAEYSGVSNLNVDRNGILNFKGRLARFYPSDYGANTWSIADHPGVAMLAPSCALVSANDFVIDKDAAKIINSALFTPEDVLNSQIGASGSDGPLGYGGLYRKGCLIYHPASIAQFGPHPITGQSIVVAGFAELDTFTLETAIQQCINVGIWYVWKFNQPQTNIASVTLRPVPLRSAIAEYHWNLMCNVEIGDVVQITCQTPHGAGFDDDPYIVEGITYQLVPGGDIPDVTLKLDLSPQAYYNPAQQPPDDWGTPP